ncbi:MAG TPA: iron chelate uptake ABC transporter family permease subunit, partial [Phycisphaerae bacterium]|nr:iron chelate uptake ABC transporter family permease subunit [Phycisphaerae bacterium]
VVGMMTSAAVCLAGPIGFVGLIVPHICRLILGPDHRRLLIFSAFVGAMFLMFADTLCKNLGSVLGIGKIPVGVVTALCGGPFFIVLLRRRFREATA